MMDLKQVHELKDLNEGFHITYEWWRTRELHAWSLK